MPAPTVSVVVVCTGLCLAGAHVTQAQEATSANLPDQFQTGEMIQIQKPKKKKSEANSQIVTTAPMQDPPPIPEQMPAAEEPPTHISTPEEKRADPDHRSASVPSSRKSVARTQQASSAEEPEVLAVPAQKKPRPRKRQRPTVQPAMPSISEPLAVSLSVAQSMAITAPLPDYTYEMKRRNLSGSGVCIVTVDPATGTVTNATMFQSTGNPLLDKLTMQTFRNWRFRSGTVSRVRVPISYE